MVDLPTCTIKIHFNGGKHAIPMGYSGIYHLYGRCQIFRHQRKLG